MDTEARTSPHAPQLPVQAAPGHHAPPLGWATAGLPGSPLLGCSPVCALAPAQLLPAASALTHRVLSPALGSARDRGEGTACPTGHCSTEHQLTPDLPEPRALLPGPGKLSPPPGRACAIAREIATLGLMAVRNCDYQTSSEVFTARSLHGGALRPSPAQSPPVRSKWISPRGHCPRLWAHIPPLALSPLTPTGPTWRLRAGPCPCTAPSPLPLQARPDPGSLWTTSSTCHFCPHSPLSNLPLKIPQPPHSSRDLPIPPVTPEVFTRWGRAST